LKFEPPEFGEFLILGIPAPSQKVYAVVAEIAVQELGRKAVLARDVICRGTYLVPWRRAGSAILGPIQAF
jgi:hypothetical protein